MSELFQIQYDTNCYDPQTCLNLFRFNMMRIVTILKHVWTCSNMSKLFRFNTIRIATILKHVWTCLNMSKLVQIQYDMNCYDSYDSQNVWTCLNMSKLSRFNMIWIHMILNPNMFKHVKTYLDSKWYELLRFPNMSEHD